MKNRPIDFLIGAVLVYLFIGICVVTLQWLSGAKCGPIRVDGDYVYTVNVHAPRLWLWRMGQWLPIAWENLLERDVSIADYISPKECLFVPAGKTPAEVWELANKAKPESDS